MTAEIRHWDADAVAAHIAVPEPESDKYRRGVLGVRTGSTAYPGAAVLSVEAAWRTGVGMVRYAPELGGEDPTLGLPTPAAAVLAARPETVFASGAAALGAHCDAWLVGSGTDPARRSFAEREALRTLFAGEAPVVVDAGALTEVGEPGEAGSAPAAGSPSWPHAFSSPHTSSSPGAPLALTPHAGEFVRLWEVAGFEGSPALTGSDDRAAAAARLAIRLGATVLLKGSVTVVATPGGFAAGVGPATPWLAAAGTGDVLAGILGALAATHASELRSDPELFGPLAASAAVLHDAAARIASGDLEGSGRGRPIAALDVAHALPDAVAVILGEGP